MEWTPAIPVFFKDSVDLTVVSGDQSFECSRHRWVSTEIGGGFQGGKLGRTEMNSFVFNVNV